MFKALRLRDTRPRLKLISTQGYALIEYPTLEEARAAVDDANNSKLLDQTIAVDFAFVRPPPEARTRGSGRGGRSGRGGSGRARSRSPGADETKKGNPEE